MTPAVATLPAMLAFVDPRGAAGGEGGRPFAAELHKALDSGALIDLGDLLPTGVSFDLAMRLAEALADRYWAMNIRAWTVLLNPDTASRVPEVAFWMRRWPTQPVYLCRLTDGPTTPGAWGTWAADRMRRDDAKLRLAPWKPDLPVIETPRLRLTFATMEQVEGYYHAIIGTDMFDTLLWEGPSSVEDLQCWSMSRQREYARSPDAAAHFAIIDRKSNRMIGGCSWRPRAMDPAAGDIGYTLAPEFQNQGLGTEAVRALVDWIFQERSAKRVEATVFVGNERSRKVLLSLGFEEEGLWRAKVAKRGRRIDEWAFVLLRDRWEAARS